MTGAVQSPLQELTGQELTALIEDPEHASVRVIAAEALRHSGDAAGESLAVARAEPAWSRWVAPAPFTVKMRLFCLPYAGGVSENVFARCANRARGQRKSIVKCAPDPTCQTASCCRMASHSWVLQSAALDGCGRAFRLCCRGDKRAKRRTQSVCGRWATMLPASIQVCPVELPGRGRRQAEPAINDVARLADVLADALPLQVRPCSMGRGRSLVLAAETQVSM